MVVMEIIKIEDSQSFNIADVSFAELKVIRDACSQLGKGGVQSALEVAKTIEEAMENITI